MTYLSAEEKRTIRVALGYRISQVDVWLTEVPDELLNTRAVKEMQDERETTRLLWKRMGE